ncbi:hypothetical protein ACNKHP_16425 [Shigella boydii]
MTRTTTVAVVGTFMGLYPNPFNILLTILGAISYATEDSLAAALSR